MDAAHKKAILLLKFGISFAFLYPAVSAFINPTLWIGYVPAWVELFISRETFLPIFSTFEIIIACGVLFFNKALPSVIAGLVLVSIVVLNKNEFSFIFRDLVIASAAFTLAILIHRS